MIKLGNINLDMPFFQAPLSGYSDRPMRVLSRRYGAPLTFTGVMLDKVSIHPKAVKKLVNMIDPDEHPVGAQILGSEPDTMARSAVEFEKMGFDLIDLNFACPVPKVLRRGRGGYLLQKPQQVRDIYRAVRQAVKCPVLMKIRIGFDHSEPAVEDFWQICQNAAEDKVEALAIHGRTVTQRYRGSADWKPIAEAKQKFPDTTIIGSGDIMTAQSAIDRLEQTGVDGVLIARGAIGNPWIFAELKALWHKQPLPDGPAIEEQGSVILEHFEMVCHDNAVRKAIPYFRKFLPSYCKRHPDRKKTQMALISAKTQNEIQQIIRNRYSLS